MNIRVYNDPVLRSPAEPCQQVDGMVRSYAAQMTQLLLKAKGWGLAAPQVGISKRLIVIDYDNKLHIIINPEIIELSGEEETSSEGCLSFPFVAVNVPRKSFIHVKGLSLDGKEIELGEAGMMARILQHEIDHLNGKLIIDYLSPAKRHSTLKGYGHKLEAFRRAYGGNSQIHSSRRARRLRGRNSRR